MNVYELSSTLSLNTKDFMKQLNETSQKTLRAFSSMTKSVGGVLSGIGNQATGMLSQIGNIAKTALTMTGDMVVSLGKEAVNGYKDYEQYIGGIKKLYGKDADEMIAVANNAYKTTGMSANQYMQTVTSFTATLLKSLNGDTHSTMVMADLAMKDMSDNANTFGTDMERLQAAYVGFSRGNFTMLDNLNLGYAGTKEGMKDLIAHANELRKAQGKTATLSINSFADIIEAVHLVQEELNIAGTTEHEAATTIEGSLKTLSAAWQNYVTGLADANEYSTVSVRDLVDAAETALSNLIPAFGRFVDGISETLLDLPPFLEDKLPKLINDNLPGLIQSVTKLISTAAQRLPRILRAVLKTGVNAIIDVVNGLLGTNVPHINRIRFPTWDDVKAAAQHAWTVIRAGFSKLGKLVFGTTADGGIKWPEWSKIKPEAEKAFHDIFEGIANLPGKLSEFGDTLATQLLGLDEDSFEAGEGWELIGAAIFKGIKDGFIKAGNILAEILDPNSVTVENSGWGVVGGKIFEAIGAGFKGADKFLLHMFLGDKYVEGQSDWSQVGKEISDSLKKLFNTTVEIDGKDVTLFDNIGNTLIDSIRLAGKNAIDFLYGMLTGKETTAEMTLGDKLNGIFTGVIDKAFEALGKGEDLILRLLLGKDAKYDDPSQGWHQVGMNIHDWIESIFSVPEAGEGEDKAESVGEHIFKKLWEGMKHGVEDINGFILGLFGVESWDDLFKGIEDVNFGNIIGKAMGSLSDLGDDLYAWLNPDAVFEKGTGWLKFGETIGHEIINGLDSIFKGTNNLLLKLILGNEWTANSGWGDAGKKIHDSINELFNTAFKVDNGEEKGLFGHLADSLKENIGIAFMGIIDGLYGLLNGEAPDAELTLGQKLGGILIGAIDTAMESFDNVENLIFRIFLGEDADQPNPWVGMGKLLNTWINELLKNLFSIAEEEGAKEGKKGGLGGKIFEFLWKGVVEASKSTSGLLLGLIAGDMKKTNGDEIETWLDFFVTVFDNLKLAFADFWDSVFDGAKIKWNDFADFINKKLGTDFLPKFDIREFDDEVQDVEQRLNEVFKGTAGENKVSDLVDLYATAKESGEMEDWKAFVDELEKVADISGIDLTIKGNPLEDLLKISKALAGINGRVERYLAWGESDETAGMAYAFGQKLAGLHWETKYIAEPDFTVPIDDEDKKNLADYIKLCQEYNALQDEWNQAYLESDYPKMQDIEKLMDENYAATSAMEDEFLAKGSKAYEQLMQWTKYTQLEPYEFDLSLLEHPEDLEAPVDLEASEGSEADLQGACDGMNLTASVSLIPDTSGFSWGGGGEETSEFNAKGLDYVPVNDYLTRLHKGEAVLTASEARAWRNGNYGVDTNAIAGAVKNAITEAMGNMMFVMNGKQVANAVSNPMGKKISGFQQANSAGYGR